MRTFSSAPLGVPHGASTLVPLDGSPARQRSDFALGDCVLGRVRAVLIYRHEGALWLWTGEVLGLRSVMQWEVESVSHTTHPTPFALWYKLLGALW